MATYKFELNDGMTPGEDKRKQCFIFFTYLLLKISAFYHIPVCGRQFRRAKFTVSRENRAGLSYVFFAGAIYNDLTRFNLSTLFKLDHTCFPMLFSAKQVSGEEGKSFGRSALKTTSLS